MHIVSELKTIIDNPYSYLQKLKENDGKKIMGYVCSYAPEELIYAAGFHPVRLFGANADIHLADTHLQSYCCSLVRGILEEALSGRLDFMDGVVFPHTCDSIQRLSDIWRLNIPQMVHADFVLPVKLNTAGAKQYLVDILAKFKNDLEKISGVDISDEKLRAAIQVYNRIRSSMMRLYELRRQNPAILTGRDFHSIIRAAMVMDRGKFLEALTVIVSEVEKIAPGKTPSHTKRLVLTGSVCSHPDIYGIIETAGGVVVWDDLCTGSRYFEGILAETIPPLTAIAGRYLTRSVCPAKHTGLTDRGKNIVRMARESRADGVVFLLLKFCDPHAFDYPYVKEMLDSENIPCMTLDVEEQLPSGGQLETRLETFIQIL